MNKLSEGDKRALADAIVNELRGRFIISDPRYGASVVQRAGDREIVSAILEGVDRFFD